MAKAKWYLSCIWAALTAKVRPATLGDIWYRVSKESNPWPLPELSCYAHGVPNSGTNSGTTPKTPFFLLNPLK